MNLILKVLKGNGSILNTSYVKKHILANLCIMHIFLEDITNIDVI